MRLSDFWKAADAVFGQDYSRTLCREQALTAFDSMTPAQALAAGVAPRDVWHALCDQMQVPAERRDGGDPQRLIPPVRHRG